jgi:hypothetical protein
LDASQSRAASNSRDASKSRDASNSRDINSMDVGISRDTRSRDIIGSPPELASASMNRNASNRRYAISGRDATTAGSYSNSMTPPAEGTSPTAVTPVTAGKAAVALATAETQAKWALTSARVWTLSLTSFKRRDAIKSRKARKSFDSSESKAVTPAKARVPTTAGKSKYINNNTVRNNSNSRGRQ